MDHIRIVPDIDSDPDIEAAGWCAARVHGLLLKVSAMKDLRGRIPPQFQSLSWLAKRWNLTPQDLPGVNPEDFISNGVARLMNVGLVTNEGGTWVIRSWDKFYSRPKTGKERTQEWRDRVASGDNGDGRDECDATPPHPPNPTPPTPQKPPPPTPSAVSAEKAGVVVAEEIQEFLAFWRGQGGTETATPAALAGFLGAQKAKLGAKYRDVLALAVERFHGDRGMRSHRLGTFLKPSVSDERIADAAETIARREPVARRL